MKKISKVLPLALLIAFGCQTEHDPSPTKQEKTKEFTQMEQARINSVLSKHINPNGKAGGNKLQFKSVEELEAYFANRKNSDLFQSETVNVTNVKKNRLFSAKAEDGAQPFQVSASFTDFGPSSINIMITISGSTGPDGMYGQSNVSIQPYGYYMGDVNSTVNNVSTTANNVSFNTVISNTTSLEVAGIPVGTVTQTMNATVNYNASSGQMSYTVTSSHGYE